MASRSFGVLTYWRKAALCHRPSVWIIESSRPTSDAVVAAPILKLCPAKSIGGNPIRQRTSRNCATNYGFRTGFFAESKKNGPACEPRSSMNSSMAVTGHTSDPVFLRLPPFQPGHIWSASGGTAPSVGWRGNPQPRHPMTGSSVDCRPPLSPGAAPLA